MKIKHFLILSAVIITPLHAQDTREMDPYRNQQMNDMQLPLDQIKQDYDSLSKEVDQLKSRLDLIADQNSQCRIDMSDIRKRVDNIIQTLSTLTKTPLVSETKEAPTSSSSSSNKRFPKVLFRDSKQKAASTAPLHTPSLIKMITRNFDFLNDLYMEYQFFTQEKETDGVAKNSIPVLNPKYTFSIHIPSHLIKIGKVTNFIISTPSFYYPTVNLKVNVPGFPGTLSAAEFKLIQITDKAIQGEFKFTFKNSSTGKEITLQDDNVSESI